MTNRNIINPNTKNSTNKGEMSMTKKNTYTKHNWEIKQLYRESDAARGGKIPNKKKTTRFIGNEIDKRLKKYGLSNLDCEYEFVA